MHLHYIEDSSGDIVDTLEFCSDYCHRDCLGDDYKGWNGCHESEFDTSCGLCGAKIHGACGPYPE
jgi:hypothetical protein